MINETVDAPIYNIKAVSEQTKVNPITIRSWERRYGLPNPKRTSSGHRRYSDKDIEVIKWLSSRQSEGISIGRAVEMWHLRESVDSNNETTTQQEVSQQQIYETYSNADKLAALRKKWIEACLVFDQREAEQILSEAFAFFSPELVCIELLQKGMAEMGQGWDQGQVSIQQEHFASALTIKRLEILSSAAPPSFSA